ncbi:ornithine carbamoyltransferase [Treponema sp. Marseille-Q4130]|uniref:ornithine carbamoyltransferase n=1 Tax=Treponema sp. Marseille-Q4130 TaxID=2766702 RepID=UPI0016522C6D|nr:ornithine carbamoyltransferase [Treponema sp. Marseille-Q4130]MBC6719396.1 ornithine carbamoyltransferase [Treponema sp. Marseille-Q4130]
METFKAPFKGRSLLNWIDWSPDEIETLLDIACTVKAEAKRGEVHARFAGKTIALIFEKRSTRTRSAFESAFGEEGGHPVFMSTQDIQLGAKESVKDTARVLGRMFNAIEFRGFKQEHAEELSRWSGVPVINGLTDAFHPTQALADVMTLKERFGKLKGLKWCFCGDGRNNVARSLMLISAKLGIDFSVYSPKELFPDEAIQKICAPFAAQSGAKIAISDDKSVVRGADCLYTDVWVSMGEEALKDARTKLLSPFRVTEELMRETGKSTSVFMHCLPAVKGEEVSEAVFESEASIVWDEAENRKHTIKAIMLAIM